MLTWATLYYASEWVIRLAMLVYVPQRRTTAAARSLGTRTVENTARLADSLL